MYTLGIDIGSTTSKCVILEDGSKIIAKSLVQAGTGTDGPERAYNEILDASKLKKEDIAHIVATGYGRAIYTSANADMSELSCHAKGVHFLFPDVRTIIDIGGQDAKVIRLNQQGIIDNFLMNDKCAAGTGRFLDVMANILQISINELEVYASKADNPVKISSTCTVFAESEVISQLAKGVTIENVVAGICESVASRVAALAKRNRVEEKVYMSGGVAQNAGVRNALAKELGTEILFSEYSQYMGALGAAIAAYEKWRKETGGKDHE